MVVMMFRLNLDKVLMSDECSQDVRHSSWLAKCRVFHYYDMQKEGKLTWLDLGLEGRLSDVSGRNFGENLFCLGCFGFITFQCFCQN